METESEEDISETESDDNESLENSSYESHEELDKKELNTNDIFIDEDFEDEYENEDDLSEFTDDSEDDEDFKFSDEILNNLNIKLTDFGNGLKYKKEIMKIYKLFIIEHLKLYYNYIIMKK